MTRIGFHRAWMMFAPALLGAMGAASSLRAEDPAPPIIRVRGIIERDQTWSNHVLITDDVQIQNARVTVTPGAIIEFVVGAIDRYPILTIGSPNIPGRLVMEGEPSRPIIVRTRVDTQPGRIVAYCRPGPGGGSTSKSGDVAAPSEMNWRHVIFQRLGYSSGRTVARTAITVFEPAITIHAGHRGSEVRISECSFQSCARLRLGVGGGANLGLSMNTFTETADRIAVELAPWPAAPPGESSLSGNLFDAAVHIERLSCVMTDNVMIGAHAAIVVEGDERQTTVIQRNYVHNTATEDDGRYALKCDNPAALIDSNIFSGASTPVYIGSRRMSGNVMIAASRLSSPVVRTSRSHALVHALPAGAVFERNILIGPAYSLLIPQPLAGREAGPRTRAGEERSERVATSRGAEDPAGSGAKSRAGESETGPSQVGLIEASGALTSVRNNLFDGMGDSSRAIQLNPAGREETGVCVYNNIFLRIGTLVFDERQSSKTLAYADFNAVAPPAARAFDRAAVAGVERGKSGFGSGDVILDKVEALRLSGIPRELGELDSGLQARRTTPEAVRRGIFEAYAPLAGSPVIGAGRREVAASGERMRTTIGPSEPVRESQAAGDRE